MTVSKENKRISRKYKETSNLPSTQLTSMKIKTLLKIFLYSVVGPAILYSMFFLFLHYQEHLKIIETRVIEINEKRPTFLVYSKSNETYYLKHVFAVLERLGFQRVFNDSSWDLLWAHDYPFRVLSFKLKNLEAHQRVNHFPGSGYITNKVDLSTTEGWYMPAAFKLPEDQEIFTKYIDANPTKSFVQKSNDHRGISILDKDHIDFDITGSFVQEFIDPPFLVDGYKFDIGIYAVITSIDPLRVYVYKGDVLFRFCPVKYYPFDSKVLDKYVVGDDYLPIWNVPSLKTYYTKLGFSMKDSFDAYVKSIGGNPEKMWEDSYRAIQEVILAKENQIRKVIERFGSGRNFFELIRFDFTLDENLNVYMMEANMSPNLSSAHYSQNQLLYEQVIFNLFALIGIGRRIKGQSLKARSKEEDEMEVAIKNLVVFPDSCMQCEDCFRVECQLCSPCFTTETRQILSQTYLEHQNKMDFKRIFPPPITENMKIKDYTLKNQLLIRWYQGKCKIDSTWCN